MKTSKQKITPKKITAVILIVAIVLVGGIGTFAITRNSQTPAANVQNTNDVDYNTPTNEQKSAGEQTKSDSINKTPEDNEPSDGTSSTNDIQLSVNQLGSTLAVVTRLQKVSNTGTCELVATNGSATINLGTVGIQEQSNYASCKGWNIPVEGQLSNGTWTMKVTVMSDSSLKSASSEVEIR
jgi:hypothetical protein